MQTTASSAFNAVMEEYKQEVAQTVCEFEEGSAIDLMRFIDMLMFYRVWCKVSRHITTFLYENVREVRKDGKFRLLNFARPQSAKRADRLVSDLVKLLSDAPSREQSAVNGG